MTTRSLQDIKALLDSLHDSLIQAGVPARQVRIAGGIEYKIKQCARAFDWLHQFSMCPQLEKFRQVRALRPETVWQHYAHVGVTGLREQVMLKEAGKALVLRWNVKRPRMFGPDKPPKEEFYGEKEGCQQEADCADSSGQCVQSDGNGSAQNDC